MFGPLKEALGTHWPLGDGLGVLADYWGIVAVYQICAFLPLLGLVAFMLPEPKA